MSILTASLPYTNNFFKLMSSSSSGANPFRMFATILVINTFWTAAQKSPIAVVPEN